MNEITMPLRQDRTLEELRILSRSADTDIVFKNGKPFLLLGLRGKHGSC